jgi:large subunit ribosomal protein L31e
MAEEIERIYVIPLKKTSHRTSLAAPTAVKRVKTYLKKHMKVEEDDIWVDDSLNRKLWERGKYYTYSKIRVKAVKFDDGVVEAYLPELEFKKSRREILREEKEKKEPLLLREEAEEGEEEAEGAEDYEISPAADGEVKIKKKKPHKEKKEEEPSEKPKAAKEKATEKTDKKTVKKETPAKKTEKTTKKKPAAKPKKKPAEEKKKEKPASKTKSSGKKPASSTKKKETKEKKK